MSEFQFRVWWKDEFDELGLDLDENESGRRAAPGRDAYTWSLGLFEPRRKVGCDSIEEAAAAYADYFYHQRDGYDATWPCEFVVFDRNDGSYHVVSIHVEYEPSFSSANPTPLNLVRQPRWAG